MKKEDFYAPDWKERQAKYKLIKYCTPCIVQEIKPSKMVKVFSSGDAVRIIA